ncbi:MAG: protein-glutamate O-methyltransferase CheR [Gemmatimonadota bacterium]
MIAPAADPPARWSNPAFERVVRLAGTKAGLTFPDNRREITEAALRRAMLHIGISDPVAFADRVTSDVDAYATALTELTVGETYFFRDPGQWDLIRRILVPSLLEQHPDGHGVRAWSAGCASGEEAYSLAIVLSESGCIRPSVVGTDLCEHRLGRAARGVYTKWSMRGVDDVTRHRYFTESAQNFHLRPEFRDVQFRQLNLAEQGYGAPGQALSELDLILCRNVLIYIDPPTVADIFTRLVDALREGGWLMIAASDPQPDPELPLEVVVTDSGLLFRKNSSCAGRHSLPDLTAITSAAPAVAAPPPRRFSLTPTRPAARIAPAPPARVIPPPRAPDTAVGPLEAYRAGKYTDAIAMAEARVRAERDDAATWIVLARANANRGDLDAAARACAFGIARHPGAAELYIVESAIETQRERYAAAAEAARRALYIDRGLVVAHLALGTALLRLGDSAAADRALRAAERGLVALGHSEVVPASDGALAQPLLNVVRAHRAMLERRGDNGG